MYVSTLVYCLYTDDFMSEPYVLTFHAPDSISAETPG